MFVRSGRRRPRPPSCRQPSSPCPSWPTRRRKVPRRRRLRPRAARWEPPETARLGQIQQWKKLKAQSDAAIRGFARGGKELRAFVSDQVDRLRLARHNLFCGLAPPGRGEA